MLKPKNVVIPAVIGFVLSFLISLIATHRFGSALLRGVLFAVAFGVLAVGITFLYSHFLDDGSDGASSGPSDKKKADAKTGSVVDITVADENLAEDDQGPKFYVANNKHSLGSEDTTDLAAQNGSKDTESNIDDAGEDMENIPAAGGGAGSKSSAPSDVTKKQDTAFKSVELGKPFPASSGAEGRESSSEDDDGSSLEDLPDIGEFSASTKEGEEAADDDIIEDSDFAEKGQQNGARSAEFPDGSKAKNHDAETMAKAIRTLLKKEE